MTSLLERIRNDRYGAEYADNACAKCWNAASSHIERLIVDELRKPDLVASLRELRDAPVLDLRLKHALTGVAE